MKKRLISIFFALLLVVALCIFFYTLFLNIVVAAVGCLMVYELSRACGLKRRYWLLSFVVVCLCCFVNTEFVVKNAAFIVAVYIMLSLTILVIETSERPTFAVTLSVAAETLFITFALVSLLLLRSEYLIVSGVREAPILFAYAIGLGSVCDTFAFTFGKMFGKRSLAPLISPKKTVEGAIGGVAATAVFSAVYFAVYSRLAPQGSEFSAVSIIGIAYFAAVGVVGGMVGMVGDLAASIIKRERGIKDFGNIMPGHGGAFDRMDSLIFTIPFCYLALMLYRVVLR